MLRSKSAGSLAAGDEARKVSAGSQYDPLDALHKAMEVARARHTTRAYIQKSRDNDGVESRRSPSALRDPWAVLGGYNERRKFKTSCFCELVSKLKRAT